MIVGTVFTKAGIVPVNTETEYFVTNFPKHADPDGTTMPLRGSAQKDWSQPTHRDPLAVCQVVPLQETETAVRCNNDNIIAFDLDRSAHTN